MEFKFTDANAIALAEIESASGGVISAGPELGDSPSQERLHQRLGEMLRLELFSVDRQKVMALVSERLGEVLSPDEIETLVADFQVQLQRKVSEKMTLKKSA
jgi:adenylate kinase